MKVLKTIGIVVGVIGLAATGIGLALGGAAGAGTFLGVSAGTFMTIGAWAGVIGSALSIASVLFAPRPNFGAGGNPLQFQTNPQSGLPYAIGRTRMSGLKIAGKTAASAGGSKHDLLFFAALLSCAPALAVETFKADNVTIAFDGSTGAATTSGYAGWMGQKVSLGPAPQTSALALSLSGTAFPGWTSAHKLSGMPHAIWALRYDKDGNHYEAGAPEPAWIVKGRLCYDPRKDSTYPGGSGSQRSNDESTWEWTRNPALQALTWCLGRYANGKKVAGIGAPIANIRVADFVEAANVAEVNGWGCGGVEYTTATKWDVLVRMLQAGGAVPTMTGAMIGCRVQTPRVSIVTIPGTELYDDLIYQATKGRRDRINTVLPRYVSEDHGWEVITGSPISVPAYVTADGGIRSEGIDFPLVQAEIGQAGFDGAMQAGQLAAYAICNSREAGPVEFTTSLKYIGVYSGDCVTLDAPDDGFSALKLVITGRSVDIAAGRIRFTAETETDSKHAFALGQSTTPPPAPTLTVPPAAVGVPSSGDWTVVPVALADGQAGLRVSGTIADPVADTARIAYRKHGAGSWTDAASLVGTGTLTRDLGPLDSATSWDVRLAYSAAGRAGDWLEISSVSTGGSTLGSTLTANDTLNVGGVPAATIVGGASAALTSGMLTKPVFQVFAYADGTVPSWTGAGGTFKVKSNGVDVTASASFAATPGSGVTGTIDAAGNYAVTAMTVDSGVLTLTATYGGQTLTQIFSVSKLKTGAEIVASLPATSLFEGREVFLTSDGKLYRYHSGAWTTAVPAADITGQLADAQLAALAASKITGTLAGSQIANGAISAAKFASGLEPVTLVSSVPGSLATRAVFNTTDGKLYRWSGSAYVETVAAGDITGQLADAQLAALAASKVTGQLSDSQLAAIAAAKVTGTLAGSQIADGVISAAKFASGLEPVTLVSSVPGSLATRAVFNTTDGKLYRWTGSAYVASVAAADISGALADAQIASLAAAKVTGTLSDSQLAAISAAKVTGQITGTQIADGVITTAKVAAGAITSSQIAADTITAGNIAAGAVTASELAAGAVVAGKIAAGTIQAADIAAAAITGDRIAANTITSSQIAADTITAGNIAAGAVTASELAAGAVRAQHILVAPKSLNPDPSYEGGAASWSGFVQRLHKSNGAVPSGCPVDYAAQFNARDNVFLSSMRVVPGEQYQISGWANKGSGGGGGGLGFVLVYTAADGTLITATVVSTTAAGWQYVSGIGTVPAGAAFMVFGPWADRATYTGEAWYGDFGLLRVNDASLIVDGAISASKLAAGAVVAGKIAAGTIQAADIAAAAITGDRIAANTITAGQMAADAIVANAIQAGAITGAKLAATSVVTLSAQINDGVITNAKIGNLQVDSAKIADLTVGTDKITANAAAKLYYTTTGLTYVNSGAEATVASVVFTKDRDDSLLQITVHTNARLQDNYYRYNRIYVDGVEVWSSQVWPAGDDTTWATEAYGAIVAGLAAGDHTIQFRAQLSSGASTNFSYMNSTFLLAEERKR